jgi:hypothetical protein
LSANVQVYVVPDGIISDVPEGVKLNTDSEQELKVASAMSGTGFTVTLTSNAVPEQLLIEGVTL